MKSISDKHLSENDSALQVRNMEQIKVIITDRVSTKLSQNGINRDLDVVNTGCNLICFVSNSKTVSYAIKYFKMSRHSIKQFFPIISGYS